MIVPNLTFQIHKIFFSLMNVTQTSLFYSDGQMLAWWLLLVNSYERTVVKVCGYLILHLTMWSEGKFLAGWFLSETFYIFHLLSWCWMHIWLQVNRQYLSCFICAWFNILSSITVWPLTNCTHIFFDLMDPLFVSSYPKQNMIFWYFVFSVVSDCHEDMRRLSIKYVSINPKISEFKYKGCKAHTLIFLN